MVTVREDLAIAFNIRADPNGSNSPVLWEEENQLYSTYSRKSGRVRMPVTELWAGIENDGKILYGRVGLNDPYIPGTFAYRIFGRNTQGRPDNISADPDGENCPVHEYPSRVHTLKIHRARFTNGEITLDEKGLETLEAAERAVGLR